MTARPLLLLALAAILYLESSPGTLIVQSSAVTLDPPRVRTTGERVTLCRPDPDSPAVQLRVRVEPRRGETVRVRVTRDRRPCGPVVRM